MVSKRNRHKYFPTTITHHNRSLTMRRIHNASSTLGQVRGQADSNHIDSSVISELGWGGHSFAVGSVTYGNIMQRQHCALYVSEKSLMMISITDGDNTISRMTRGRRQEQSWEVKISMIEDIQLIKGGEFEEREFADDNKERLRQCCVIYLRNCAAGADLVYVDTFDSPLFSRQLIESWHSCACGKTAGLGKPNINSNPSLAREYLDEVISCYSMSHDLKEKIEILDELSKEVNNDLEMKDAVFKHREMLVLVLSSCHKALTAPSGFEGEVEDKIRQYKETISATSKGGSGSGTSSLRCSRSSPQTSPRDSFDIEGAGGGNSRTNRVRTSSTLEAEEEFLKHDMNERQNQNQNQMNVSDSQVFKHVTYDDQLQKKLEQTVINRMHFFHSALKLFVSLFFYSESVGSRVNALTEDEPLSPSSWLEFLAPDLMEILCKKLKCNLKLRLDKFNNEILLDTIGAAPAPNLSASMSKTKLDMIIVDPTNSTNPYIGEGSSSLENLLKLSRSVADYQIISTLEISRIASRGIQNPQLGLSRVTNHLFHSRCHIPIGELWVRQSNFDAILENLMNRISSLLDDIVLTERAKERENYTGRGANRKKSVMESNDPSTLVSKGGKQQLSIMIPPVEDPPKEFTELKLNATSGSASTRSSRRNPTVPPSPGKSTSSNSQPHRSASPAPFSNIVNAPPSTSTSPLRQSRESRRKEKHDEAATPTKPLMPTKSVSPARGKRDSFIQLNTNYKLNQPDKVYETNDVKYGPLETQEILLYYTCQLLKQLVLDSPRVREVLTKECNSLWAPISVIFNVICPRNAFKSQIQDAVPVPPIDDASINMNMPPQALGGGGFASYLRCLISGGNRNNSINQANSEMNSNHNDYLDYVSNELGQHDYDRKPVSEKKSFMDKVNLSWIPISHHGPPRVSINKYAWELLVLSRRCIDECMNIMGLHTEATIDRNYDDAPLPTLEVSPRPGMSPIRGGGSGAVGVGVDMQPRPAPRKTVSINEAFGNV